MINPYTHPSVVGRDVVHTIGNTLAEVRVDKQPSDGVVAHVVALLREGLGEMTGAFARPQQRRLRIPTRRYLQQGLQILEKGRVTLRHSSPSPAYLTEPLPLGIRLLYGICGASAYFNEPSSKGGTREARSFRDRGDAPPPDGHCFAGSPAAPHFFVQHRAQRLVFGP